MKFAFPPRGLLATGCLVVAAFFAVLRGWGAEASADSASSVRLLFVDSRGGLWLGDLSGTNSTRLPVEGKVIHAQPAPSMERLLYVTEEQKADPNDSSAVFLSHKLFVTDFAGSNPQLISDKLGMGNVYFLQDMAQAQPVPMFVESGGPRQAQWNADSRRILYTGRRDKDGSYPIYVADVVDKTEKELARIPATKRVEMDINAPLAAQIPASPLAERFVQERYFLKLYNAPAALNLDPPGAMRGPRIVPGGVQPGELPNSLRVQPGQSQAKPRINAWFGSTFSWHPDGKLLTWSSSGDTNYQGIYVREAAKFDPADPKALVSGDRIYWGDQFLWSPSGEFCAVHLPYAARNGGLAHQVFLSTRTNVARVLLDLPPVDRTTTRAVTLRAWSPDG
ncbi:MAG: PD40 domain-containing protein, partial [Verrucomicrobia bacterium]|nr:PD40 domain-containing protein [Verrucomicrobiota bacterium]